MPDAIAITRLLHELAESEGRQSLQSESTVTHDLLGEESTMRLLVAEAEDEVVGIICYYLGYDLESASHGCHLADIIVTKTWRGQGIGTRLMKVAAQQILEDGGEWLSWTVLNNNRNAIRFYERAGGENIQLRFMAMGKKAITKLIDK